ncbi:MAG TPA: ATPase, T2SS/T4P/T4SS family [Stellaceae bacterium]|nr:ATPase, T2SS/T4P/T4SS family [Stellaceae bacterium]
MNFKSRERYWKDRRKHPRKRVVWPATLETVRGKVACRVSNISPGGARLRVDGPILVGEYVTLVIPAHGEFDGVVAWQREAVIGMEFGEYDLRAQRNRFVTSEVEPQLDVAEPSIGEIGEIARPPATLAAPPADVDRVPLEPSIRWPKQSDPPPAPARIAALNAPLLDSMPAAVSAGPSLEHKVDDFARAPNERIRAAIAVIHPEINAQIDAKAAAQLSRAELAGHFGDMVSEIAKRQGLSLSRREQISVIDGILDEMLGFGPLEPLLADETVTDILVNGAHQVYVERRGKLELTGVSFADNSHLLNIILRIVTKVGRRIDEGTPLVDARLPDGSRVNVIVPPLALKGPMVSIRKFAKKRITLGAMVSNQSLTPAMALLLKVAARCRLNTLISGGTGSGKTTLLDAMAQMIDPSERILTIEDAAELRLPLPHVGSLETRPPNLDGNGEVTVRDLFRNALRMRPDRIIIGEIRGTEAFDMLQAMNCGHDGSLSTIHASGPREALSRLESVIAMSGIEAPSRTLRAQIASAIDLIVQVDRARDGKRRVTNIVEVVGMDGDVITTQPLFSFQSRDVGGALHGHFASSGLRPYFLPKADYYGLREALLRAVNSPDSCEIADLAS